MNKLRYFKIYGVLLLVLFGYMILSFTFQGANLKFASTAITPYEQPWEIIVDGNKEQQTTLPVALDIEANQKFQLKTTLPQAFLSKQTMLYRSSLQYLRVYLNNELIYENLDQSLGNPPVSSMWNTIELPENANNKQLVLEIVSPYKVMASHVNGVYFGDLGSIYLYIFSNHGYFFIVSSIIVILSTILLMLAALYQTHINRQTQLVSLFTLILGLWMIAESRMLQFFIPNQFIHASLAYLLLASFIIPMLIYIKDYVFIKNKISLVALIWIHGVNIIYVLVAQLTGFASFFETVQTTNYLLVVTIVALLIFFSVEVFTLKNKQAINFFKRLSVLFLAGLAEFINFFLENYEHTSNYLVFGLMIFLIIQIIDYLKVANDIIHQSKMAQEFERLATIDPLTKAKNRTAFDRDNLALYNAASLDIIRISFFDVNNLKIINDTLGHSMGDEAIVLAYQIINESFKDIGETYRVGGDEFACILLSAQQDVFDERIQKLLNRIDELQSSLPYKLDIAYGSALFDPKKHESISDVLRRADEQMYLNKQIQKDMVKLAG